MEDKKNIIIEAMDQVRSEVKPLNIYKRLSAITAELATVAKNLEVGTGNFKYKAVSESDVLRAVKPLEEKHGVYSYPVSRTIIESGQVETGNGKKQLFERIEVTYRFVNVDDPKDFIDIISYGDGIDSGDKSVGKAMTYADKYALLKAYKINTGEDPDKDASDDLKGSSTRPAAFDNKLMGKCNELNIDLIKLATYLKKDVAALTNDDLKKAIAQKEKALEAKK